MSTNNINPSILLNGLRDILDDDAPLQGSLYLTSINRIFTRRAPTTQPVPYLVIECKDVPSDGTAQFITEVRIFCYTKLLANGQIDGRGDLILYRCQELLNDQNIDITGLGMISMTTTPVPSFLDPEDPQKARAVLRIRVMFGTK
jgi:hypothetical protein